MTSEWLVPAAIAFGAVLGAGIFAVVMIAHSRGQRAVSGVSTAVPDGVDEVLDQPRDREVEHHHEGEQDQRANRHPPVGLHEPEEAAKIVHLNLL